MKVSEKGSKEYTTDAETPHVRQLDTNLMDLSRSRAAVL